MKAPDQSVGPADALGTLTPWAAPAAARAEPAEPADVEQGHRDQQHRDAGHSSLLAAAPSGRSGSATSHSQQRPASKQAPAPSPAPPVLSARWWWRQRDCLLGIGCGLALVLALLTCTLEFGLLAAETSVPVPVISGLPSGKPARQAWRAGSDSRACRRQAAAAAHPPQPAGRGPPQAQQQGLCRRDATAPL